MKQWHQTKHPGVRYREHPTRRHGVGHDRYFMIRYQRDGRRDEEIVGWASDGWTAEKAAGIIAELKQNIRTGSGAMSLREKRELEQQRREKEAEEKARFEKDNLTFGIYFDKLFHPNKKELGHFNNWIKPVLSSLPLKNIRPLNIERIKKDILDAGKTPRQVEYVLGTVRKVWNHARNNKVVAGDSPTKLVKNPKFDNRRVRFLSPSEADALLTDLQVRDPLVYQMALISLHCGLRASEIFSLRWQHVDVERRSIFVVKSKSGKSKTAYMTKKVRDLFLARERKGPEDLVFPNAIGEPFGEIPESYAKAVKAMGFNNGISDSRYKVVFHTLRHTYASWQVESGTDLYTVKELLGHKTTAMTERYSHLSPKTLQSAVGNLERFIERGEDATETSEKVVV